MAPVKQVYDTYMTVMNESDTPDTLMSGNVLGALHVLKSGLTVHGHGI